MLTPAPKGPRVKLPLTLDMVRRALDHGTTPDLLAALVLVGLAAGLSRSELFSLTWGQVRWPSKSLSLDVDRGRVVVPEASRGPCAVRALDLVRPTRAPSSRRVFEISSRTITRTVKRIAKLAGEDPARFSAGSLRAGYLAARSDS
jgi:integrase